MTEEPKAVRKANIAQPELRPLEPNERIVRVAGLKFILPCRFSPGQVLDEEMAAFINTAWHTAIINRFGPIRESLLDDVRTTYEDFESELQAFADTFKYTPRILKTDKPSKDEEDKAIEAYARPMFNKAMRGHGLERARYEELLQEFITDNREMLRAGLAAQQSQIQSLTAGLLGLSSDGNDDQA